MDELIDRIIQIAKEYKEKNLRPLGVTGEVGEHIVSDQFELTLASHQQGGYDATTKDNRKIQIKSRIFKKGRGRIGNVKEGGYEHLVVAAFDDDFNISDVYILDSEIMEKEFVDYKKRNGSQGKNIRNPSWSKIKQIGKSLKNKDGTWSNI